MTYKEKTGEALKEEARSLGLSEDGWYEQYDRSVSGTGKFREAAVQARVREAKRARRDNIVVIVSTLASLFSAIAAWVAVLKN